MSDSEETCGNIKSLKAHRILSLCFSCHNFHSCGYRLASDVIADNKTPGVQQEHIISTCFSYKKVRVFDNRSGREVDLPSTPEVGNLQPRLWDAQVKDLCACCPSEVKDGCKRHQYLDKLAATSYVAGTWVKGQVVCCNQSERLYQISEPKKESKNGE